MSETTNEPTSSAPDHFTCGVCGATAPGPIERGLPAGVICENHEGHAVVEVLEGDVGGEPQTTYPVVVMRPLPFEIEAYMEGREYAPVPGGFDPEEDTGRAELEAPDGDV